LVSLLPFTLLSFIVQKSQNEIAGKWFCAEADNTTMNVYKSTDGLWYSTIHSSDEKVDIGKNALRKLSFNSKEKVYEGELQLASNGLKISVRVNLEPDGSLKVAGRKLIITKTFYWKRVK
jgi:hypothetical protein